MSIFSGFASQNSFDPDAGAFINATGIGGIEAVAINNLVNQLKTAGLWTKLLGVYPMVGGTSTTCKFNLINPQDTDAAYRLSFGGTWTFSNSGAKPNGASGTYADTFFVPNTKLSATTGHLSYYSFTNSAGSYVEIGVTDGAATNECLTAVNFGGNQYSFWAGDGGAGGGVANGTSLGFYITNKNPGTTANIEGWKNGVRVINTGTSNQSAPASKVFIGAESNSNATNYRNSDRGCSFASFGYSFASTADTTNFSNIVNTFQTTLQRNTF